MAAESSAGLYFERILNEGVPFLRSLVASQTQETEWLEFKGGEHCDAAQIRDNWSRALCGFANNEGGVLVWGIDARRDKATQVDAASALSLVPSAALLCSRLTQLHPTATEPPIPGVRIESLFDNGKDGPGFVACLIPETETKPHRAELVKGKPYLLRIGDSFVNPSPSILRNLFHPRSSAQLVVDVQPKWERIVANAEGQIPNKISVVYHVTLRNLGLASAKEAFTIVNTDPPMLKTNLPHGAVVRQTRSGTGIECQRTIHPMSAQPLCFIQHEVAVTRQFGQGASDFAPYFVPLYLSFRIFALDTTPAHFEVRMTDDDIERRIVKQGRPVQAH